jgi:hypothetical protein
MDNNWYYLSRWLIYYRSYFVTDIE